MSQATLTSATPPPAAKRKKPLLRRKHLKPAVSPAELRLAALEIAAKLDVLVVKRNAGGETVGAYVMAYITAETLDRLAALDTETEDLEDGRDREPNGDEQDEDRYFQVPDYTSDEDQRRPEERTPSMPFGATVDAQLRRGGR